VNKVAIAITAEDRPKELEQLLNSLDRAKLNLEPIRESAAIAAGCGFPEIVVVGHSTRCLESELIEICHRHGVRWVLGPRSVSAKRNLALDRLKTEYVLFLDDDCVASPGLLTSYVDALQSSTFRDLFVGAAGPVLLDISPGLQANLLRRSRMMDSFSLPCRVSHLEWAPTANLLVERRHALDVGGFDERHFGLHPGGEDLEFCLRLTSGERRIQGVPGAIANHNNETWNSFVGNLRRFWLYGRGAARALALNPDRRRFQLRHFEIGLLVICLVSAFPILFKGCWRAVFWPVGFVILTVSVRWLAHFLRSWSLRESLLDTTASAFTVACSLGHIFEAVRLGDVTGVVKGLSSDDSPADRSVPFRPMLIVTLIVSVVTAWTVWFLS